MRRKFLEWKRATITKEEIVERVHDSVEIKLWSKDLIKYIEDCMWDAFREGHQAGRTLQAKLEDQAKR